MIDDLVAFDEVRRARAPLLAGVDEAGRGPWAGPVAAAAVILKPGARLAGLNDSKKLTPLQRERLFDAVREESLFFSVQLVDAADIDRLNILNATFLAMRRALENLGARPDLVLVDGNQLIRGWTGPQESVVAGDGRSAAIAAASILAKVTRDRWMIDADARHPGYGFAGHKGYGAPIHQEALRRLGPCAIHRRSFAPIRAALAAFPV